MSLTPSHKSGRPIVYRKQTLAPISTRHNPLSILVRQLFPTSTRDTGTGIYYNIHDPRPDYNDNDDRQTYRTLHHSDTVVNLNDYRTHTSTDRMSARDTGSHPSTLRSVRSRRLGRPDRMARIKLSARRSLANILQGNLPTRSPITQRSVLPDRLRPEPMGRSISEHQSRSESLRRIRQTTLDSLNNEERVHLTSVSAYMHTDVRGTTNGEPA